ncbi:AI-2E family transporter [Alteraurantiacibacter aquimixticola]|uniref:AI-2E family transporter n=1 Tax=Alteraurantiacibacter aquimixticola TaxID=2489173 RepID=A0A4T3F0I5_9SPHN|nr:AI-2E family transporter [Alteraurantiacibacter aquimixticola]TIX50581.1 AI-2E family transporter [Alteraurantiacibacter aquimixticola]
MNSETDADDMESMAASPTRITSAELRHEVNRAAVWIAMAGLVMLAVYISQSLLVIFGAMVFAAMIDGGARLLGRALNIGRGWRIAIVLVGAVLFLVWLGYFAGSQISREAAQLPEIVEEQGTKFFAWLRSLGFSVEITDLQGMISQAISGFGTVTRALGGLLGGLTTLLLITIIGVYIAIEPRLYERGVAWMLPKGKRRDFHLLSVRMAYTMRRLMAGRIVGMVVEGVFTYFMLIGYGVVTGDPIPMPALLAILTGLLAFVPNIGAVVSGVLMVMVGFSGGTEMGIYTIIVYLLVQNIDGYIVIPMIAKKTVDLAPALVLGAQLIMGILFGILGLFLADPLLAMIKVALERRSEQNEAGDRAALEEADRRAREEVEAAAAAAGNA